MEYIIVSELTGNPENLAYFVNEKIRQGYVLQGGVSVAVFPGGGMVWCQAMIKNDIDLSKGLKGI